MMVYFVLSTNHPKTTCWGDAFQRSACLGTFLKLGGSEEKEGEAKELLVISTLSDQSEIRIGSAQKSCG